MNYWRLGNKEQRSLGNRIEEWMFRLIDVESQQRNKIQSFVVLVNYLLSYTIIFFVIMQSLACQFFNSSPRPQFNSPQETGYPHLTLEQTTTQNYKIITIFLLIRLGLTLVYIVFQKLFIMAVLKALIIVNIFLTELQSNQEEFISIEIPLIILQLAALGVWAYKIERRIVHFDSRLKSRIPYAKESLIFFTVFLVKRLQKMTFSVTNLSQEWAGSLNFTIYQLEALQIIVTCLICVLFMDFSDILYNRTFKELLISLDFAFLALIASWAICVHLTGKNIQYFNYLALFATLIGLQMFVLFRKEQFKELYEIQSNKLDFHSETKLIKYFQAIRFLIKTQKLNHVEKNIAIIRFILFHRSSCLYPTCPFTKRYNMQDPIELKCELIEEYMLRTLEKLSVTRPLLKKYLIFYLSPKDKIFRYIDEKESYMKRQTWRMKQVKRQLNNQIRILEAEVTKKIVTEIIEEYLTCGKRFFELLMKENINCGNLVGYGQKMIDYLDKAEQIKTNSTNFTQGVRVLINNFSTRLINDSKSQILQTVVDPPFLINKTTESGPTMIVSAQPENFLRIIDANIACTKEFYYPREVFLSVTVIDLLPDQIKVKHREHFERVSKKTDFDGQKDFPTSLFVINKNGFMTFFTAVVYLLNSIKGRMWCVAVEITHKMDAILLVAMQKNGVVMGISQMAVFHGLKKTDKGKEFKETFYKKLRTKIEGSNKYKSVIIEPYQRIFDNSEFEFFETKNFEITQEYTAFGFTYFLVQIRSVLQPEHGAKGRSSILRSLISLDNKTTSISINEEQVNFVPKRQMFYHTDGIVRSYAQKDSSILQRFDNILDKADVEEQEPNGQLGNGITEMRLIDEQLDFLENIEQENEFLSKPKTQIQRKQYDLKRFEMKREFFQDCFEQRKQMVPEWLKYTRIFFVVILIVSIILMSINFAYNNAQLDQIQNLQALLNGISSNLINYIKLSKVVLAAKYFNPSLALEFKSIYDKINKQIEQRSQEMFGINPNVEQYFSEQQIDKTLSRYLIAYSDLAVSGKFSAFAEETLLGDLVLKITPAFNTLMDTKTNAFQTTTTQDVFKSLLLPIGFVTMLGSVFVWVCIIRSRILKKRSQILIILSKIRDSLLQRQLVKVQLFQQYLYFDHDIFCQDDLQYIMNINKNSANDNNQQKQKQGLKRKFSWKNKKAQKQEEAERAMRYQKGSEHRILVTNQELDESNRNNKVNDEEGVLYIKRLINKQSLKGIVIVTVGWIALMGVFSGLFFNTIYKFSMVSEKIFRIEYNIQRMESSSDIVWVLLNYFPYNNEKLAFYEASMYNAEATFKSEALTMSQKGVLTKQFLEFYEQIWTQDACDYIESEVPGCRGILNGALQDGADQIIAYLNRKYDFLMDVRLQQKDFRTKQSIKRLSNIQLSYMNAIVKLNMQKIAQEHDRYADAFERDLFIYFIMSLVCLSLLGLVYKMLLGENQKLIKLEKLFKLIDFDSLKDMNEFKLYYKENYHDRMYK